MPPERKSAARGPGVGKQHDRHLGACRIADIAAVAAGRARLPNQFVGMGVLDEPALGGLFIQPVGLPAHFQQTRHGCGEARLPAALGSIEEAEQIVGR